MIRNFDIDPPGSKGPIVEPTVTIIEGGADHLKPRSLGEVFNPGAAILSALAALGIERNAGPKQAATNEATVHSGQQALAARFQLELAS